MTAATTTHSVQHLEEDMVLNSTLPVKAFIYGASVVANEDPADFTNTAHTSEFALNTYTVSGVAVGDVVVGYGVVATLAANSYPTFAYVSATDTITCVLVGEANTAVTTTAPTLNFIVADVT